MAYGFRHVPEIRTASLPKEGCPWCWARYDGTYGFPHICKESTFQSMPIIRFETFEVENG